MIVRHLGRRDYATVWHEMKDFTLTRGPEAVDEFWIVEHPPVFTQGLNGKQAHLLDTGHIPVINVDRGGQVTYHGPGQLVVYTLLNIQRRDMGIRHLVTKLEQSVIDLLADYGIEGHNRRDAPGVYVADAKIASLGLRVKRGCCYHGLSLNVDMDLTPFSQINPCGMAGLQITQLKNFGAPTHISVISEALMDHLAQHLGYVQLNATGAWSNLDKTAINS